MILVVAAATLVLMVVNSFQISSLATSMRTASIAERSITSSPALLSGPLVVPTGTPEIYGTELGVNYDDVSSQDQQKANVAISKLKNLDLTITLTEKQNERYVNALYKLEDGISCEYCCGARSIIFETGKPACGCAHSYAMRGLAKYLITEHGDEYTDEQILEELAKWKTLFFPGQMQQKAQIMEAAGLEVNFINLGSNKYRDIEKQASGGGSGGMVGGC